MPLWADAELAPTAIAADVESGLYFVAYVGKQPAAAVRLATSDPICWPEAPDGSALYVHRLAVRRRFAGQGLAQDVLRWCCEHARALGLERVRLDCDALRPKLRHLYERFGFVHHSDLEAGSWPSPIARYELIV